MLAKFENYLGTLPLTKTVKDRINECLLINAKIVTDEILEIFICDLKNSEGARSYTSLWLFTDMFFVEFKDFLVEYDHDMTVYKDNIRYSSIKFKDFDLETATESSSIVISCVMTHHTRADLIATGSNCTQAFDIYKRFFVKNVTGC